MHQEKEWQFETAGSGREAQLRCVVEWSYARVGSGVWYIVNNESQKKNRRVTWKIRHRRVRARGERSVVAVCGRVVVRTLRC